MATYRQTLDMVPADSACPVREKTSEGIVSEAGDKPAKGQKDMPNTRSRRR